MLPTITQHCSDFLLESAGKPLLKNLSVQRNGFTKVKVRHQKTTNSFVENFNGAFLGESTKLLQRSVFTQGESSFLASPDTNFEPFYVFPVDGYSYMYNPLASTSDFNETFHKLIEKMGERAPEIFRDLLKYNYVFDKLSEGIESGSEIIIYGISHYYALRKSLVDDYEEFLLP